MSVVLDAAQPPPHLLQSTRSPSWPCPPYPAAATTTTPSSNAHHHHHHHHHHHPYDYPADHESPSTTATTTTTTMSPQPSLHSYMSRLPDSPLPSQDLTNVPSSAWYGPSVSAPDCHHDTAYAAYAQFGPPHTSSITLSSPTSAYHYLGKTPVSTTQMDPSAAAVAAALSPNSVQTRDSAVPESSRPSEEPQVNSSGTMDQSSTHWRPTAHLLERPHSSSSSNMHPASVNSPWAMNSLAVHNANMHHDQYYGSFPPGMGQSPRLRESLLELPSHHPSSPQPRRMYTSIAPQPLEIPRSSTLKRVRDDEEASDDDKRRKRSDSNTSAQFELSEEDRLLLQLKEEEAMPWKDIAARFQSDLGKSYQIPALQMRLKRLRERMRVWTEADVRALRMAHEYWAQNKFDIIAQKMLEFGAQEKWTARQCARKYAEIDPAPTPYAHFEHLQPGFAPYAMSPVEASHPFLPYMNNH